MSATDAVEYTPLAEPAQIVSRTSSETAVAALVSLAPTTLEVVTPEQAAIAWIDHLRKGGAPPAGDALADLLHSLVASRVPRPPTSMTSPAGPPGVRMVLVDTAPKFPHMIDTQNGLLSLDEGIWTQCKTKMTHICVRLVNAQGESVQGTSVQPEGLRLRLTLHKVSDFEEELDDDCNPRESEGLFRGRASGVFEPEVLLTEGRHEFRFQVLLLSSDIGGARMFVKVAPVDSSLASNTNFVVRSRSFISRARMPDDFYVNRAKRSRAAAHLLSMAKDLADAEAFDAEANVAEADSSEALPPNQRQRVA